MTYRSRKDTPPPDNSWAVRLNRWTLAGSRHYLKILLTIIAVYVTLPLAAPLLMRIGLNGPARVIYSMYSPLCHQFAFRSWFVFGEQYAYPRAIASVGGLRPYETYLAQVDQTLDEMVGTDPERYAGLPGQPPELIDAKLFIGNEQLGYKVAVCQRDVGIYLGVLTGGLIYAIPRVRRYLRPVPILLYALLGVGPIAIDGVSQLLSQAPFMLWPLRESTPLFRLVTGALFGLMNAWLAFPYMEASAREVIREIETKFERRRQRQKGLSM